VEELAGLLEPLMGGSGGGVALLEPVVGGAGVPGIGHYWQEGSCVEGHYPDGSDWAEVASSASLLPLRTRVLSPFSPLFCKYFFYILVTIQSWQWASFWHIVRQKKCWRCD
jgi:hypothetical protein